MLESEEEYWHAVTAHRDAVTRCEALKRVLARRGASLQEEIAALSALHQQIDRLVIELTAYEEAHPYVLD